MSHWEFGVEFEIDSGTSTHEFGVDLAAALRRAERMEQDRRYRSVTLVRRRVGDWEPMPTKEEREMMGVTK